MGMDVTRRAIFTDAAFAENKYRRLGGGHPVQNTDQAHDGVRAPDHDQVSMGLAGDGVDGFRHIEDIALIIMNGFCRNLYMFFMAMGAMDVHDRGRFAGFNHGFQRAVFTVLAAGLVYAVGNLVTVLTDDVVTAELVMILVFLVSRDNLEIGIDDNKRLGKQINDGFAGRLDGRFFHLQSLS